MTSGEIPMVDGDYAPPPDMPSLLEVAQSEAAGAPAKRADSGDDQRLAEQPESQPDLPEPPADPAPEEEEVEGADEPDAPPARVEEEAGEQDGDPLAGLPKPQEYGFDPGKLEGEAKDVHRYYSSVLRHKGREHKEALKQFEGITPEAHQQLEAFTGAVIDHPMYEQVIEPLLNPTHPSHKALTQKVIQIFQSPSQEAPASAPGATAPATGDINYEDVIYSAADEDGVIHPEALQKVVQDLVQKQIQQGAKTGPAPAPAIDGQEVWEIFQTKHGLPQSEEKQYGRIYVETYGKGPLPQGVKPLQALEKLKLIRDAEIRGQMAQASRDTETERKGSMPPPSRSTANAPPKPLLKREMTLREVQLAEKEGRL